MSPYWLIAVLIAIFGAAILGRSRAGRPPRQRESRVHAHGPLQPGEVYDTTVKLTTLPNVPLADLWCQRLRQEGIEAFYKTGGFGVGLGGGLPGPNPGRPTEIWIGEHDLQRARELFHELA